MEDERIAEALVREVMEEGLRQCHLDGEAPALPPGPEPQSEAERQVIVRLGQMIRQQSIILEKETKDYIDGFMEMRGSMTDKFLELARKVFQDGVTWGKIILLLHVAGRMAVKVMDAKQHHLVNEIFKLTLSYFKEKLLGWVASNGGWSNCLSELSGRVPAMPLNTNHVLIVIAGLAFLGIVLLTRGA